MGGELPAILPSGDSLFPEFWPIQELQATRDVMPPPRWAANYQQSPTSEQGAIIKRDWWRNWSLPEPPSQGGVILLDRWLGRVEFPELKKKAKDLYDQWKPEALIIERKALP